MLAMGEVARGTIAMGGLVGFLGIQVAAIMVVGTKQAGSLRDWWRS